MREAAKLFAVQAMLYAIVCCSWRAVAYADVAASCLIDFLYALLLFTAIKDVAATAKGTLPRLGFALGSAAGTWIGIALSLRLLGK